MNREIRFRAFYGGKMLEVGQLDFFTDGQILVNDALAGAEILQYTGLKDRLGKEIFDGDILSYHHYHNGDLLKKELIGKVEWDETGDSDGWAHEKHYEWIVGTDSLADVFIQAEVIGNIWENPELIK